MQIEKVVVVGPRRLWQFLVWGVGALLLAAVLLGISLFYVLGEVSDLRQQAAANSAARARQFAELNDRITNLSRQLQTRDARVKQLEDQLIREGIVPDPAPAASPSPTPGASPTPKPSPRPRPSRSPHESPSASGPSCLPVLPHPCITPPPALAYLALGPLPFLPN